MKKLLQPIAGLYNRIPVRLRLAFGLVGLMTGSVLVASAAGFFPNEQREILRGRARICETLAISSTAMASTGQIESLQITLESVVNRDPAIESIGLVSVNGGLIVSAGPHEELWSGNMDDHGTHMSVPVFRQAKQWGELQIRFGSTGGLLGLNYWAPAWLLIVVIPACFLQFSFFLKKTLQSLDPSGAVPTHVEKALDTFTVGLVLLNSDQRVLFANKRLKQLLNKESSELIGKYVSASDWIVPDANEGEVSELPWERAKRLDDSVHDQILQMDVNGRRLTFTVNCTPITGQGFLTTFDDITLIEENKVALAEARDAAQNANEAKSEFLANMSHEIRTPLNAVLGFTDVLRRGLVTDSDEAVDHLNMIHRSGAHLLELINDILDLSKIEAGAMEVESIETRVDAIMMDVANTLRVRADENGLDLHVRLETPIPRMLSSDPTRLRQVITNLVGNAIKFTEEGSVSIIAAMRRHDDESLSTNVLRIDVVDTGIGMTKEQQSRIFESFAQADSTTTRKFGGTGLGLSISRRLTEAMDGNLTVHSKPGLGSTFRIELPLDSSETVDLLAPAEFEETRRQRHRQNTDANLIRLPGKRVLVVDDGESNRRLIELVLQRAGAEIVTATNGLEAIERISEQAPALVLMDMQMPVLDGYTATERLRQSGFDIPIVALTGNAMVGDREKCMAAGCDDFLSKPVNLDELLRLASKHLGPCEEGREPNTIGAPRQSIADSIEFATSADNGHSIESVGAPIYPTLPMDDADFREITMGFLDRLPARLAAIEAAINASEFDSVHGDAHWLKGAGGTVGLDVFTSPARELEAAAKSKSADQAKEILVTLRDLQSRVSVTSPTADCETSMTTLPSNGQANEQSIVCTLPLNDPDFKAIVSGFVSKLDERLIAMKAELEDRRFDDLALNAHWLKGAGGTVGYAALTQPAASLLVAAKREDTQSCQGFWCELMKIRQRMIVPTEQFQPS